MNGKQRIVTTALQILLEIKGWWPLPAHCCSVFYCALTVRICIAGQAVTALSALRCRTSLQSLLNCESHLRDFPPRSQTGLPDHLCLWSFLFQCLFSPECRRSLLLCSWTSFHSRDLFKLLIPHLWSPPSIYVLGTVSVPPRLTCVLNKQ